MKILIAVHSAFASWCIPDEYVEAFEREFPEHAFVRARTDQETLERIHDVDAVFGGRFNEAHFAAAKRLRWIQSPAAGVGNMLFPAMIDSPIVITNARGNSADTIGEHVIGVTLAMLRDLPLAWRRQQARVWAQDEFDAGASIALLKGSRALVIGLGSIGAEAARLLAALGARVTGIRRRAGLPPPPGVTAVHPPEALDREIALADVVVVAAPHTPDTSHMIGAGQLAAMQDGAVLVNVSRGQLVDEAALARELAKGRLRAALDVFEHEPLDAGSPLWDAPNVLITPHVSGFHSGYWRIVTRMFTDNLRRFAAGLPLENVVDKRAGY